MITYPASLNKTKLKRHSMAQGKLKKFRTDTHKYKTWIKRRDRTYGRMEAERIDSEKTLETIQTTTF